MNLHNDYQWLPITSKERKPDIPNGNTQQLYKSSFVRIKFNVNLIKSLDWSTNL